MIEFSAESLPHADLVLEKSKANAKGFLFRSFQIYNWGTFSGFHHIPISEEGFLILGSSGSGKSTLLDAFSTMTVPPKWLSYNSAAREGEGGRYDRSLMTYMRGAYGNQSSDDGDILVQYLRGESAWSALSAYYEKPNGECFTLVQLFWVKGPSLNASDVKKHYIITKRRFDIKTELKDFSYDLRELKAKFEDDFQTSSSKEYFARFSHLAEIESDLALKLLHKTQSAKNLGDLNLFLREFMLEEPKTFAIADELVKEFFELDEAHRALVDLREERDLLRGMKENEESLQMTVAEKNRIAKKIDYLEIYCDSIRTQKIEIEAREKKLRRAQLVESLHALAQAKEAKATEFESLRELSLEGDVQKELSHLERELTSLRAEERQKRSNFEKLKSACETIEEPLPETAAMLAHLALKATTVPRDIPEKSADGDEEAQNLFLKQKYKSELDKTKREIESLSFQSSNIPLQNLNLRADIAAALNVDIRALPFAGELLEVKEDQLEWQGAIERLLSGFALSILVSESLYEPLSRFVNQKRMTGRLVYYKVDTRKTRPQAGLFANAMDPKLSLLEKLDFKEGPFTEWLQSELERRFDYACVKAHADFRFHTKALTKEGLLKHNESRHEKNDRYDITDRRHYVLGFSNEDKLDIYRREAEVLNKKLDDLQKRSSSNKVEQKNEILRALAYEAVSQLRWEDLDLVAISRRKDEILELITRLKSGNLELQKLSEELAEKKSSLRKLDDEILEVRSSIKSIDDILAKIEAELAESVSLEIFSGEYDEFKSEFQRLFANTDTLKALLELKKKVEKDLTLEKDKLGLHENLLKSRLLSKMEEFNTRWPQADLLATLESFTEYMQRLELIEKDRLPSFESKFASLLKQQSRENLAALYTSLVRERQEIRERMELVNKSLRTLMFTKGTYLSIETKERHLPSEVAFREDIKYCLHKELIEDDGVDQARFKKMREIVRRLASADPLDRHWRAEVLDVRTHVEFIGVEKDRLGNEVEVHRSGASKSGGQREKLATTCLAAALRYQLGGRDGRLPSFAPIVIDEAFAKADLEFTQIVMEIFKNLGFQMIVATPMKSVLTLEPYIGGAALVKIADRKVSRIAMIDLNVGGVNQ